MSLLVKVTPVSSEAKSETAVGDGSSSGDGVVVAGHWLRHLQCSAVQTTLCVTHHHAVCKTCTRCMLFVAYACCKLLMTCGFFDCGLGFALTDAIKLTCQAEPYL